MGPSMNQPTRFEVTNEQIIQAAIEAFNTHHEEMHIITTLCDDYGHDCDEITVEYISCHCEGWKKALEHLVERVREECYQQYKKGALHE